MALEKAIENMILKSKYDMIKAHETLNPGGQMINSSVRCDIDKTLDFMRDHQVDEMIEFDSLSIVTVTERLVVQIDGTLEGVKSESALVREGLFNACASTLFECEKGCTFDHNAYYMMMAPIRRYENYKVFSICVRKSHAFDKREFSTFKFAVTMGYEELLLDNKLTQEQNYIKNIFDSVASFIISFNMDDTIAQVNRIAYDRFSIDGDPLIGKNYKPYLSDIDRNKIVNAVEYVKKHKKTYYFAEEVFHNIKKGRLFTNITISPILGPRGDCNGVVLVGVDMTRQKLYEIEIEQLQQFSRLGELATGLAHDIKNPLTIIRGCSRILEKKVVEDSELMEFISPIVEQVDRINDVINHMLSYSFITQKSGYSMIDLNEVLEKCINVIRFHAKSKNINMSYELEKNLPMIKADNVQLQQAFLNIMFNALEAIRDEGNIFIKSYICEDGKSIGIMVRDDGEGMNEDIIDKIFEPLYTNKTEGNGIGLSISKRLFSRVHGSIDVKSKLGQGTDFIVTFLTDV